MSAYDALAAGFDGLRALPSDVLAAVRRAVLRQTGSLPAPLVLDLGAGSGRFGKAFVAERDRYVAVDLSFDMLRAFAARCTPAPLLAQANGERLPFADATFDAVLLMQVVNGARDWHVLLAEAMRVVRCRGPVILGRRITPDGGIDARMRRQLTDVLAALGVEPRRTDATDRATRWFAVHGCDVHDATVAAWTATSTPRAFLERHTTGVRFSMLTAAVRETAMLRLREWAVATFGSLDAEFLETFRYDLVIARQQPGASC